MTPTSRTSTSIPAARPRESTSRSIVRRAGAVGHRDLEGVPASSASEETPSSAKIYGKRIIVMGGGAQVGQVALGAISEADRHNIRGERISIDTIPLVGEQELAAAVRAVMRLPRVQAAGPGWLTHGRRDHQGGRRGPRERPACHLVEHGRQRARRRRSRRQRSGPGRRHGRHGGRRHREVRPDATVETEAARIARHMEISACEDKRHEVRCGPMSMVIRVTCLDEIGDDADVALPSCLLRFAPDRWAVRTGRDCDFGPRTRATSI